MLQPIWDFTKRHQRGLLITAGVVGGIYGTTRFIRNKLANFQRSSSEEMARRTDLKRRFEQNQNDCLFTVMALLPALIEQLDTEVDVDGITMRLRNNRQNVSHSMSASTASGSGFVKVDKTERQEGEASDEKVRKEGGEATVSDGGHSATNSSTASDNGHEMASASFIEENTIDPPIEEHPLDRLTKAELWQELKIRCKCSFTRTITATYLITLLTLLTHLQLNLVGRHIYVASVAESGVEESREAEGSVKMRLQYSDANLSTDTERDYLSFSWWLLHVGWYTCVQRIREATTAVIGDVGLRQACSYKDLSKMINQIRDRIEDAASISSEHPLPFFDSVRSMLLPDDEEDTLCVLQESGIIEDAATAVNPISSGLRRLLDETRDFIDSPDFTTVLAHCLNESFGMLLNRLQVSNFPDPLPALKMASSGIHELTPTEEEAMIKQVPLAKLLPDISHQVHEILNGVPNPYLDLIANTETLRAYSAIVYSAYDTPNWQ
ncbi:Peroxin-3 [Syncephalis fuscata]|nr:Peroxin-3 [Syncephalis fuscata]